MGGKVLVPTQPVHPHARRRAPGGRRHGRADGARRPHRRRQRQAAHQRRRRARPAVPHRRAHGRGLLPRSRAASRRPSPAAWPTRPTPTWSGARPRTPDLDEAQAVRRGRSTRSSPASCWPTTARRRSTGRSTSTTRRSPVPARARRHGLQVPVRHPGRLPRPQPSACSSWPRRYRDEGMAAYSRAAAARVRRRGATATRPPSTSARSAPATSTRWRQVISGGLGLHAGAQGVDRGGAVLADTKGG